VLCTEQKANSHNEPSGGQAVKRSANGGASSSQSVTSSKQPKLAAVSVVDVDEDEVVFDEEEEEGASRSPGCQKVSVDRDLLPNENYTEQYWRYCIHWVIVLLVSLKMYL
jgi:hypothetical protein